MGKTLAAVCAACLCAAAQALPIEWDSITRLTTDTCQQLLGHAYQRSIGTDPQGNVHVAWLDSRRVPAQVWYRRFDAGSRQWLPETALTARPVACQRPTLACDASGDVHIAWHSASSPDYGIWYKRLDAAAGRWRAETLLVPGSAARVRQYPAVACRPGGRGVHVAWYGTPDSGLGAAVFHVEFKPDSGWRLLEQLVQAGVSREAAALAVDSAGDVSVLWSGLDFGGMGSQVCCIRRVGGAWGAVEQVPSLGASRSQYEPSLAAEPGSGVLHAVWYGGADGHGYDRVQYCRRAPGGWGAAYGVGAAVRFDQAGPTIAWRDGRVHVAWCAADSSSPTVRQVQYCERDTNGLWSSVERLTALGSGNTDRPSLAADQRGRLHLAWQGAPGRNYDIYYRSGLPAGAGVSDERRAEPSRLSAWPSPVRERVTLEACGPVTLRDAAGRTVVCPQSVAGRTVSIDVRGLAPGVYFAGPARFVRR